mmetsp:Transcript_28044/g.66664  ORF Transcript_28044/g.66664 Transcript_28044/m.66664 type:complete len:432 (-) Transcript_28044:2560-3855(-)
MEELRSAVDLVVPLEVGGDGELHFEHVARHRLDVRGQLELGELVDEAVDRLAHLRVPDQLSDLLGRHVEETLPLDHVLLLQLLDDLVGDRLELAEGDHAAPHALVDHLAEVEALEGEGRPAAAQHDLEQRAEQAAGALRDVDHVREQREPVELQLRDVRLQQDVDLGRRLLDTLFDRDRHPVRQLLQLHLLLLAHHHVLELAGQREDAEQLDVADGRLEVVVERCNRRVRHVEVRRHASEVGRLQVSGLAVVLHQVRLKQRCRRRMRQVQSPLLQYGVLLNLVGGDAVERGVAEHADVEVRVAQPVYSVAHALDRAEDDLGVEEIGELLDHLGLDRELLVEQRQVVLQLRVGRDDDAGPAGVELRPAGAPHHLHHIQRRKLDPAALVGAVDLRAFDDDGVRGQVDTPRQRRRRHQNLDVAVVEERLYELAV